MTPTTWIPARGPQRRIQALICHGWSQTRLAALLRISPMTLDALLKATRVTPAANDAITDLFSSLWDKRPPQVNDADRAEYEDAVHEARANGWPPALAWDDIDEDDCPAGLTAPGHLVIDEIAIELALEGRRVPLTGAERVAAVHRLCDMGVKVSRIAEILHMNNAAAKRAAATYSRAPLDAAA